MSIGKSSSTHVIKNGQINDIIPSIVHRHFRVIKFYRQKCRRDPIAFSVFLLRSKISLVSIAESTLVTLALSIFVTKSHHFHSSIIYAVVLRSKQKPHSHVSLTVTQNRNCDRNWNCNCVITSSCHLKRIVTEWDITGLLWQLA